MTTGKPLEDELLICIARRSISSATAGRIHLLVQPELDWNYLLDSANRHGLMPLLYRHLSSQYPEAAPEEFRSTLKDEFLGNSRSALYLTSELLRIIELLEESGISAVSFKGPLLSLAAYGDVALRQFGDLDILIAEGDFRRAKPLLEAAGYAINPRLTTAQEFSHLHFDCQISFIHPDNGCVVDLHWNLAPKRFHFLLAPSDLFKRLQTIKFGANSLRTFSNEDLLVFLCMHGAKHVWCKLEWISSVAELIRNSDGIEWEVVVEQARRSHSLRRLLLGLMLAKDLQPDIDIPEQVFAAVQRNESLKKCAEKVRERLFQSDTGKQIETFLFHLETLERKRDAIVGLLLYLLVPRMADWQDVALPDALYPFYYVLRPIRLLSEYLAAHLSRRVRTRKRPLLKPSS